MKTNPMSEQELQEEASNVLPDGDYDFLVSAAREKTSSSGNEMIELVLEVYDSEGKGRQVWDWLVDSTHALPKMKVRHFCRCCGLMEAYEADNLDGLQCEGKSGKVRLIIEKSDYGLKNRVRDYLSDEQEQAPPKEKKPPKPRQVKPEGDEVPF